MDREYDYLQQIDQPVIVDDTLGSVPVCERRTTTLIVFSEMGGIGFITMGCVITAQ
jgi:hypothetical protein